MLCGGRTGRGNPAGFDGSKNLRRWHPLGWLEMARHHWPAVAPGEVDDSPAAELRSKVLSEGAAVTMPLGNIFLPNRFGMYANQFGIPWMVNCAVQMSP